MAVAYKNNWAGGASVTMTGVAAGDFCIASVINLVAFAGNDAITPPAGWTLVASRTWNATSSAYKGRHSIYQKVATGSEGTQTWTGVSPLASNTFVSSWTGVDTATGIEANANTGVPGDGSTPIAASQNFATVTSLTANAMIMAVAYAGDQSGTAGGGVWPTTGPSGYTQAFSDVYMAVGYKVQAAAGASGSLSVTLDSDVAAWSAWTLAVRALITGTLAATEAKDVAAITGSVGSAGTLAATEAKDTASLAGDVASVGNLAATEAQDTASFLEGSASVTGTLAATEANDVAALAGAVSSVGTLAATEAKDTASIAGAVSSVGTLAATEAKDTAAIAASVGSAGTLAATEARDTASITASVGSAGTLAATEARDTAAIAAALSITGTLAATEAQDVAAIVGSLPAVGVLAATEAQDIASIIGLAANDDVTPPERIVYPAYELRTVRTGAETRLVTVAAEVRTVISQRAARDAQAA